MSAEERNKKEDKKKSEGSSPMESGMFEMMKRCCAGQGRFPDCSAVMESVMEAARNQPCCRPKTEDTEFDGSKK